MYPLLYKNSKNICNSRNIFTCFCGINVFDLSRCKRRIDESADRNTERDYYDDSVLDVPDFGTRKGVMMQVFREPKNFETEKWNYLSIGYHKGKAIVKMN